MEPTLIQLVKASKAASTIMSAEAEKRVPSGIRPKKSINHPPISNTAAKPPHADIPKQDNRSSSDTQSTSLALIERFCENILPSRLGTQEDSRLESSLNPDHYLPDSFVSATDYIQRWEPLFLEETRASIINNLPSTRQLPCMKIKLTHMDPASQLILTRLDCTIIAIEPTTGTNSGKTNTIANPNPNVVDNSGNSSSSSQSIR